VKWRRLAWVCLVALLGSPLADARLIRTQPRFVLLHVPLWLALGYVAGRHLRAVRRPRAEPWNPLGLTGLVFFVGTLAFWMIPRSVDSAVLSRGVDQLLHASLLAAGFTLAWSMPIMPFVVRAALGIYGASMVLSLGALYTSYSALLCGTFTLAEQRQTGKWLTLAFPFIVVALLALGVRALARERALGAERDLPSSLLSGPRPGRRRTGGSPGPAA
jgi:cytochrome c oxidase assembly factor CtaG